MTDELFPAVRAAAKGTGWSAKRDLLSKRLNEYVLAVHPRRGAQGVLEFRAKPMAWDNVLWSILQIEGNEKKPASFFFCGAFTCDTPALAQETFVASASCESIAQQMVGLAVRFQKTASSWEDYDLARVIAEESPNQPYRYHMTQVVERICSGDRPAAAKICEAALAGELDLRHTFSSVDKRAHLDQQGRRPSRSFFELAQIWLRRT